MTQSKGCQKAHWKIHKLDCRLNVEMAKKAEALGPDHIDQLKAISKWSDHFSVVIGGASAHAMDIMNHPERIGAWYFLLAHKSSKNPH